jgi:Glycosyltransferase family 87
MHIKNFLAIALAVSSGAALFFAAFQAASALPAQDLAQYWSAAHLVRQDPYSFQAVALFERSQGVSSASPPLVIKNPPWAILFILPLRFFGYRVSFALWAVFSLIGAVSCSRAIWQMYAPANSLVSILLPLLFGPTIVLLLLGQWTILVLIGVTLFLILAERGRDWMAGASLLLVAGKPHIALLFLIAVALWSIQRKRWRILYSAALAMAASCVAIVAINPHIFSQFLKRTGQVVGETESYPNAGGILYALTGNHILALLPQLLGLLWLLFYWFQHRDEWDWKRHGMLVLAASVACSYYSYPYDEILVLPVLIAAFLTGRRGIFYLCFGATNLGYAIYLLQIAGSFGFNYMFLSWTATAWLVTYVASTAWPPMQTDGIAEARN